MKRFKRATKRAIRADHVSLINIIMRSIASATANHLASTGIRKNSRSSCLGKSRAYAKNSVRFRYVFVAYPVINPEAIAPSAPMR